MASSESALAWALVRPWCQIAEQYSRIGLITGEEMCRSWCDLRPDFLKRCLKPTRSFRNYRVKWVCQFISWELVMPRSLKCCRPTLSTMTGLLAEQSDKCWGENFARGSRIISFVFTKFVWGGPCLQLLKECLHVSLLWTAREEFCQSGIVHILMGETLPR